MPRLSVPSVAASSAPSGPGQSVKRPTSSSPAWRTARCLTAPVARTSRRRCAATAARSSYACYPRSGICAWPMCAPATYNGSPRACSATASTPAPCAIPSTPSASSPWSIRLGELTVDPTTNLDLPAARGRRHICIGLADALALVDALPDSERALWALALFGGLRRGELRALRWTDIDLAAKPATVRVARTWDDDAGEVQVKTNGWASAPSLSPSS